MGNSRLGMEGARPAAWEGSNVPGLLVWLPAADDGSDWTGWSGWSCCSGWSDAGTALDVDEGEPGFVSGVEHPVSATD